MIEFFSSLTLWHWLIYGLGLMAMETMIPGAFFLWPGIAAILVGLIDAAVHMPWTASLSLWAVLSLASVVAWVFYRKANPKAESFSLLNRRGTEFIGQTLTLTQDMADGQGRAKAGDTVWKVVSIQDLKAGNPVIVTAVEGNSLRVVGKDQENA